MEKHQQERTETAEISHDSAEKRVDAAEEVRQWYGNLSPRQAAEILENDSTEDDYAPVRSLAAHYQGPWLDGSLAKLLAITGEVPPSRKARTNQAAIAESVATKWVGELSPAAIDELIDISLAAGSIEALMPFVADRTFDMTSARLEKIIPARNASHLRAKLVKHHAKRFLPEHVDQVIALELKEATQQARLVDSDMDLRRHEYENYGLDRFDDDKSVLLARRQAPSQKVLARIAKFIPELSPAQKEMLAEVGDNRVHLQLVIHRGDSLEQTQWATILERTRSFYLLDQFIKQESPSAMTMKILLDAAVKADLSRYEELTEKHTQHFKPEHVSAWIEKKEPFFFRHLALPYPDKVLAEHIEPLLKRFGSDVQSWWVRARGGDFQEQDVAALLQHCSGEAIAILAECHPDKLPPTAENIDIILKHSRHLKDFDGWMQRNGPHFEDGYVEDLVVKGLTDGRDNLKSMAMLIRHCPDKLSSEKYEEIAEKIIGSRYSSFWGDATEICGNVLLRQVDNFVGKLLAQGEDAHWRLSELIECHPEALQFEDFEQLLGTPDTLILRPLITHCLPQFESPQIDRLMDMIGKIDDSFDMITGMFTGKGRESLLEDFVKHGGQWLQPEQIDRVIEDDNWGSVSDKLLTLFPDRLSLQQKDRIIQKFGYLYSLNA